MSFTSVCIFSNFSLQTLDLCWCKPEENWTPIRKYLWIQAIKWKRAITEAERKFSPKGKRSIPLLLNPHKSTRTVACTKGHVCLS